MTYSTGGLIQATDYNGFVSTTVGGNVNTTWNTTYGQTGLTGVAANTNVFASQWATLNTTVSKMANHQGTTITSRTTPVIGDDIVPLPNLGTDIASCYTNRYNAALQGSQYTAWTGTSSKTTNTGSTTFPWTITFSHTVQWFSAAARFWFFNAGGLIKIQFSKTSTGTAQDTEWNSFIPTLGTIYLSSVGASKTIVGTAYAGTTKIGGSGTYTILTTGTGALNLTTTPVTIFKQFAIGSPYSSNYVEVTASAPNSTSIAFTTIWYDNGDPNGANITGGTETTGIAFGTAPATVVTYIPPETTYINNVWGTPTISASIIPNLTPGNWTQTYGPASGENYPVSFTTPDAAQGGVFTSIYATYGSANVSSVLAGYIGQNTMSFTAGNALFGDPNPGSSKTFYISVNYS